MNDIEIPIEKTIKDGFKSFLEIPNNSRIFFSGKFGIGKTYFLNEFFKTYLEDYEAYHLYPVNYQINKNDDIIDLIKYDILVEMLNKDKDILKKRKVKGIKDSFMLFYSWIKPKITVNNTLQSIISAGEFTSMFFNPTLEKLGRPLKDLLNLDKEFQNFRKEYEQGDKGLAEEYIKKIKEKDYSETDYISQLLKENINKQKGNKKSVLILDDLDRIDPEHIFRILNILSTYFEKEQENKFGFDSIIIVADYKNIEHIFHHKYGATADFGGYLDKFYTITPYYFDNKKAVMNIVDDIVMGIKNEDPRFNVAFAENGYIKVFLSYIFRVSVDDEIINLRELLKARKYQLAELKKGGYDEDSFFDANQKIFDKAIIIAIHTFSGIESFIKKIEIIKNSKTKINKKIPFTEYILIMAKALHIKIPTTDRGIVTWHGYQIMADSQSSSGIKIINESEEKLFCDLLTEYISSKKYV